MLGLWLGSTRAWATDCLYNGLPDTECEAGGPDDICQTDGTGSNIICDLTRNHDWYSGIARAYTYAGNWEIAGLAAGGNEFCCVFALSSSITGLQVLGGSYADDLMLRCPAGDCGSDYELTPSSTLIGSASGNDGDDEIVGSNYDNPTTYVDQLHGGDDDDTIWGLDGQDQIWGDLGDDVIRGGDEGDLLYGNGGNDEMNGGAGADTLYGGGDNDTLCGDTEPSSTAIDVLNGDAGDDDLWGPAATCTSNSTRNGGNGGSGWDEADNCSYPSYVNTEAGLTTQPANCPTP